MPDATWATLDLAINEDLHLLSTEGNRPSLPSLLRPERPPERKRRETGGGNPTLKPGKKREKVGERMSPPDESVWGSVNNSSRPIVS
jgi:hypothetical protein